MRRIFAALLCVLLLTACVPADENLNGADTPQTQTSPATTDMRQEKDTEDIEELIYSEKWKMYCSKPDSYIVFQYDPDAEYDYPGKSFDRSQMFKDSFYAVADGEPYLIADQPVSCWDVTSEHIYYVLYNDPLKVYRSDLDGNEQIVVYQSDFDHVTDLEYSGIDANGDLILALNNNYIVKYNILSMDMDMLFEAHMILYFAYLPNSLSFTEKNEGPVIFWHGHIDKNSEYEGHLYFLNKHLLNNEEDNL